jgi:pimeloyl-ACP methyl ester carboxylesterase
MPILQTSAGRLSWFDNGVTDPAAPTLLLLHSSGASHRQWRQLIAQLGQSWRILAPDLFGYRDTPMPEAPSSVRRSIVQDEMDLLGALLQQVDGPVHIVGHSYGGAIAIELALLYPDRIAGLAVYEPVMFALLRDSRQQAAWSEIAQVAQRQIDLVAAGNLHGAAAHFIGYWTAPGVFEAMPEAMQETVATGMAKVADEFREVLRRRDAPPDFSRLTMPVLLLCGSDTTHAARGVIAELRRLLPGIGGRGPRFVEVAGGRHMAPLQQPDLVNPLLVDFLDITARVAQDGLRCVG